MAREGVERRYAPEPKPEVYARLERELNVIEEVGYAEYFLIFADIVEWANRHGIETLARGSAAGSLVCYALGISNVCPFRFGLCFERFLNKERMQFAKLADIDLDLPWDRRDEVVQYVFERYGAEHVAMIGAFNTFHGRAAVADIAKVYGIPEREVRRFTEHMPYFMGDAEAVVQSMPECRHLPWQEEPYRTILKMASRFEGIPRHASMHPCGLVISAGADHRPHAAVPQRQGLPDHALRHGRRRGTGAAEDGPAGAGGPDRAAGRVRERAREPRPRDRSGARSTTRTPATWDTIATGNARGVFHIESPAMTNLLHDGRLPRSGLPHRRGIDHPARRGERGQETGLRAPPPGPGAGHLRASVARTAAGRHLRADGLRGAHPAGRQRIRGDAVGTRGHPAPGAGEEQGPPQDRRNGRGIPRLRARLRAARRRRRRPSGRCSRTSPATCSTRRTRPLMPSRRSRARI